MSNSARLLIKIPSRERPQYLLQVVRRFSDLCADPLNTQIVISADDDDRTMTPELERQLKDQRIALEVCRAPRTTKIGAMNRDLFAAGEWDIVMAASDDMFPEQDRFDAIIREDMATWFPTGDGCLWYYDGRQHRLCTMSIMHRLYYERMGHIYHPGYRSYRCDDEYTERAMGACKMIRFNLVLCRDEHPQWRGAVPDDDLYERNRKDKQHDLDLYTTRKALGWP
ncbi:MAG TPA: hypothetical protein PLB89_04805 [Flavobacteriales bacterium]|nr:hypothetical protein [Flavobacteriales bacterium]